jgi:hypothetical protein
MEGVPGVLSGPPADAASQAARPEATEAPAGGAAGGPAAAAPTAAAPPAVTGTPSGSIVVFGPQVGAPALVENRPTRPISEADADRYLRAVLEHSGTPAARCTKKQYGPGWVIICE